MGRDSGIEGDGRQRTDADWSEALAASTRRPVSRKAPRKQARETTRKTKP
jgi:hypothetical protein